MLRLGITIVSERMISRILGAGSALMICIPAKLQEWGQPVGRLDVGWGKQLHYIASTIVSIPMLLNGPHPGT